jgi:CBS domain-containing protein
LLHSTFDRWFADRAAERGAFVIPGYKVDDLLKEDGRVVGIVTAKGCRQAADRGEKTLHEVLDRNICKVTKDTPANDLFALLANNPHPLAVVNEQDHLVGVIVAGSLLAKLAEVGQVENSGGNETLPVAQQQT